MEKRYYYKAKQGNVYLSHKSPLPKNELKNYTEITEKEWNNHLKSRENHQPSETALLKKQINEAKAYLAKTDYVVIKIAEETDADKVAALREEYADVITERKTKRAFIDSHE